MNFRRNPERVGAVYLPTGARITQGTAGPGVMYSTTGAGAAYTTCAAGTSAMDSSTDASAA